MCQGGITAGLHAMLGWHRGGVMVGRVHGNGVKVAVDLCVAKGEEGATTGSQVVRWRRQRGLVTLRRHGVRDHVVGERLLKDSAMLVRKETKKRKKNISRLHACKWCCREWRQWVRRLREGGGSMVACVPVDRVVIIPLASAVGVVPVQWRWVW